MLRWARLFLFGSNMENQAGFIVKLVIAAIVFSQCLSMYNPCFPCDCHPKPPAQADLLNCNGVSFFPYLESSVSYSIREVIVGHSRIQCLPNPDDYLRLSVFLEEDNISFNCSCLRQWYLAWPNVKYYTNCSLSGSLTTNTPPTSKSNLTSPPSSISVEQSSTTSSAALTTEARDDRLSTNEQADVNITSPAPPFHRLSHVWQIAAPVISIIGFLRLRDVR